MAAAAAVATRMTRNKRPSRVLLPEPGPLSLTLVLPLEALVLQVLPLVLQVLASPTTLPVERHT